MKRFLFIAFLAFATSFVLLVYVNPNSYDLPKIYDTKLQVPLFTGFLTLGSFLLTLKTFVIVKLKESLYDNEVYKARLKKLRLLNPSLKTFGALSRLATYLIYTVIAALLTSAAQMTIGFIPNRFASAICISLATTTLILVFHAWWLIKTNLTDMFGIWESESTDTNSQSNQPAA